MRVKLRLTQTQHADLKAHLFPGDGLEAVAFALCGRRAGRQDHCLTVRKIIPIPYAACSLRAADRVTWSTELLKSVFEEARLHDWGILKVHCHTGGFGRFSSLDDCSDADIFNSAFGWTDSAFPSASAVMMPDGRMFGRAILPDGAFEPLHSILVPGDDIHFWVPEQNGNLPGFTQRHAQLFGTGTTKRLRELAVAVVGCSGTGSPVVEQLARLGVGRLVLVDPDRVEEKNLNRILNSTRQDSYLGRPKVEAMARSIAAMGLATDLEIIAENLATPRAIRAVAGCDVVFGCMDGAEGRHWLNRLASFYVLPYFDIGVKLVSDQKGGVTEVSGAVHYIRPDGTTLLDRRVYTMEQIKAEGLRRTDPASYRDQVKAGYIHGVAEDRPAVISINMAMASLAVNEFLGRVHPYRYDDNGEFAVVRKCFMQNAEFREPEGLSEGLLFPNIGKGDCKPLLDRMDLSEQGVGA